MLFSGVSGFLFCSSNAIFLSPSNHAGLLLHSPVSELPQNFMCLAILYSGRAHAFIALQIAFCSALKCTARLVT